MAKIHTARNDLARKLGDLRRQNRAFLGIPGWVFLLTGASVAVLALFGLDLPLAVRSLLANLLSAASDALVDTLQSFDYFENTMGRGLLSVLLDMGIFLFLSILKILLTIFLWVAEMVAPSVVRIGLYCLPFWLAFRPTPKGAGAQQEQILRAGLEGEANALSLLKSLGDDCHIFTNLRIPFDGGESETDMIVLTPAGITIVEVKNQKGTITGDTSDEQLTQRKALGNGTWETKSLHNPIRQVGTHAYRLAGYLRHHAVNTYVCTCVLFVNPEADLRLTDRGGLLTRKCPVFTCRDIPLLHTYLTEGSNPMGAREYRRTLRVLEDLLTAGLKSGREE